MRKKIKVGLDFDGVVAYNPLRIVRLPLSYLKKIFIREKELRFYCPKTIPEKWLWILIHETSFFPAIGFGKLKEMLINEEIEGYLLTSRYSCLEGSWNRWLKKHGIDKLFKGYYLNKTDEQPHKFKERVIRHLKLDYYLDDNWDIVEYLSKSLNSNHKTEIHWIYNILDRFNPYPHRHPYLLKFLERIKSETG